MSNVISVKDFEQKHLLELSKYFNDHVTKFLTAINNDTYETATKFNLAIEHFAFLIGGGIGCYFTQAIVSDYIKSEELKARAQLCNEVGDIVKKGFETYLDAYMDEINECQSKNNK